MGEYLFVLISAAVVIGFASFLSFGEEKCVRFGLGVLFLYAVVKGAFSLPIVFDGVVGQAPSYDGGEYEEVAREAFREGISEAVCLEFSLSVENVRVSVHGFDFESMSCRKASVVLSGKAIFADLEKIEKFVTELGVGECEVEIEF